MNIDLQEHRCFLMSQSISLDGVRFHRTEAEYCQERQAMTTFTAKVLALTPLSGLLLPEAAVCIMCSDQKTLCVTEQFGSGCVPRKVALCASFLKTSKTKGIMMSNASLQTDVDLTLCASQTAEDLAFTTITQRQDDGLMLLLCAILKKKDILKPDPYQITESSWYLENDSRNRYESNFINRVRGEYPDTRGALQSLCPLALYTFDSQDASFNIPKGARAGFSVGCEVMKLIHVIWPMMAEKAWASGLERQRQHVLDVRDSHRSSMTLSLMCTFIVKTEAERKAKAMRKEARDLASCAWLPFKLPD